MTRIVASVITIGLLVAVGGPASSQNLLTCDIEEVRGSGQDTEAVYNMNCRPVAGGNVTDVRTGQNGEIQVTYGAGRPPILAGGPIYILRWFTDPGDRNHYGPPLDGNVGTVGR